MELGVDGDAGLGDDSVAAGFDSDAGFDSVAGFDSEFASEAGALPEPLGSELADGLEA